MGGILIPRLVTFGDSRLTDQTGSIVSFPEKALLAIAYLSTRPSQRNSRMELASFLWGGDGVNAQVNLRQLLSRVKARQAELGVELLVIRDTEIGLRPETFSSDFTDLQAFADALPIERIRAFLTFFTGEFCAGVDVSSERAEFWLQSERSKLHSGFAEALNGVLSEPDFELHANLIKDAAFRLLEFDAYNEVAYRVLMQSYAFRGHLSQAKDLFADYKQRLWQDLGTRPDQNMMELSRALFKPRAAAAAPWRDDEHLPAQLVSADTSVQLPRLLLMPPEASGNQNEARLAAGLLEDVTIGLCRATTVSVVAPFTARQIAVADDHARAFARYRVSYVLETSISQAKGKPTLFAGLIHLGNDSVIWAERFEITPECLASAYNEIHRKIVAAVVGQIERYELSRIPRMRKPDAYQHYLLGQHHMKRIDLPDIRRARKSFRTALQNTPDYSDALSGLARTEHLEWLLTARGDEELLQSAETHALKAIELDGDNASGNHQLGVIRLYQGAFDESINAFEGAEQCAPSHADLIADYADTLVHASEPLRGLEKINRAIDLNPLCPDLYWWTAAGANYSLERYKDALDCLSNVDDQSNISRFAAACWGMLGDSKKASSLVRKTIETYPDFEMEKWLSILPVRQNWQKELYREGLHRAGFK